MERDLRRETERALRNQNWPELAELLISAGAACSVEQLTNILAKNNGLPEKGPGSKALANTLARLKQQKSSGDGFSTKHERRLKNLSQHPGRKNGGKKR